MPPARRRVSYVIPSSLEPMPRLQLPPHSVPRNGVAGPLLVPYNDPSSPGLSSGSNSGFSHPRHRLGVASLALDVSTSLVGHSYPEGILYTGGRDGLVISWDLDIPTRRRTHRYGVAEGSSGGSTRRWEIMTNWADDIIEEEDDGEELPSDGDVLGEVTGRARRRPNGVQNTIPEEEQWEVDEEALEARKANPPATQFRQCAQLHSDWVNDILLCNMNQTLVSASSDGTVRAWNPHAVDNAEPTTIGTHEDYVRCLTQSRVQHWVASGSFDRTIKLWDLNGGGSPTSPLVTLSAPESSGPKASIYAVATDPYGSIITSGSPERVVRMWDPRSGKRVGKLVGHTDNIRAMLLSDDAKYLLTGSADASVKLWSLSSQRCLHTFTHHTESVWSLFSQHPSLEIFYSGDRSGIVCKVDVESCTDVSEGECIVVCQDTSERVGGGSSPEGVNKIVAMDDSYLWTASGSSSFRRWKVPQRRAVRAAALSSVRDGTLVESPPSESDDQIPRSAARASIDFSRVTPGTPPHPGSVHGRTRTSSPPPTNRSHRASLSPSLSPSLMSANSVAPQEPDPYGEREGEETWYGIPFESLVHLTSPHDSFVGFNTHSSFARGHDPEIATLYSAASIMSMPRLSHPPPTALASTVPRSNSPFLSSRIRLGEDAQTLHPATRARAAFEEREVAADAVPYNHEPDDVVQGEHGLVRCAMLNDRVHVLTVDTAGEVAVWDVIRGVCRGRFVSEDVAAASGGSSAASVSADGDSARDWSPREALETVRERIEGEAVVQSWASVDTKTGVLTVHLNERCFEAEIYADEVGYTPDRRHGEEQRLNIGKWVLRNLFAGFIREEQRLHSRRSRDAENASRLHRGTAPTHIDINGSPERRRRSISDASRRSHATLQSPRSTCVVSSPNMVPAMSPAISAAPRTPLLTPLIPINMGLRDSSALSPIPQSPSDVTPMPQRSHTLDTSTSSPPSSDYFSLRTRRISISTAGSTTAPDDFSSWGKDPGLQTPTTPSAGGLMGRLKAFGNKSSKRQASEVGASTPGGTLQGADTMTTTGGESAQAVHKSPAQALLSGPINPPPASDAPPLPIPPQMHLIISEEAVSGWTTIYRGQVASIANDARTLEEVMPFWLLEYLLTNRAPSAPVTKISFVLLPFPHTDPHEMLPELLNTAQSKLTASRFLRVRKLTNHVQDKLDKMAGSHGPTSPNTPRSSFDTRASGGRHRDEHRPRAEDLYEIVCNDIVLPLDMTLAAVRQFVWRQGGELSMYYRRKAIHPVHLHH
ncbi:WD40 repeat-like protein [Daedalea quercina L-15889]|uniref:WD40 repeat-like protein n=1 Tax=Daedalea quercina L-15889 TaxID=1314783 RepID=A0A165L8H8_9APHY|nr:WD40 repeat-like protein [Daedalea quercina L-15889]